jgi:hypothetical protein
MRAAGLAADIAAQLPAPEALGVTLWRGRRPALKQREAA